VGVDVGDPDTTANAATVAAITPDVGAVKDAAVATASDTSNP